MSIGRHSHEEDAADGSSGGHTGRARAEGRKQGTLLAAVTAAATGLALAVPLSAPAQAALNPAVLESLHLDSATLAKVRAYDKYRSRVAAQRKDAKKALRFARKQIGKPYRWGADGPNAYDCSGLVMAAWRKAGVKLPRVTYSQYRKVDRKVKFGDLKPGDLVFFHGRSHVGLYVGHDKFLHAPHSGAKVRINKLGSRRKKQFAGAVRPGAPAYKNFSESVKELVEKIDRMSAQKRADQKPPDKQRTPQIPPPSDTLPKSHHESPKTAPGHTPAHQAAPPGGPAPRPAAKAPSNQAPSNQAPSNQAPPGQAKPGPRPRTAAAAHPRSVQHRIWAKYTGPFNFNAPASGPRH